MVSVGAGVRNNGRVVYLRDIQLELNPENETVTTGIPLLRLAQPIDVDLGPDCSINSLVVSDSHVWVRTDFLLLTDTLIHLNYIYTCPFYS